MDSKTRPVMVTGGYQGRVVFFGWTSQHTPDAKGGVTLERAQNLLIWCGHGLSQMASTGPSDGCRVGPPVERQWVGDVTTITDVSDDAVRRWESQPW